MVQGWLQVAQEALKVPGVLVEIYGDLAKPGVKQAGVALGTVIGLGNTILWPIALANERARIALEKNLEKYRKAMELVPEEKVVEIAPEIGVPIAEKLTYVTDESLTDMYVNLLATSSSSDTLGDAHPSFVNVINNLSPDEARLLEHFVSNEVLPFVIAKAVKADDGSHNVLSGAIVPEIVLEGLNFPNNVDAYLNNLEGLGLLDIRKDEWLTDDTIYKPLQDRDKTALETIIASEPSLAGRKLEYTKGAVARTSFGRKFIAACHK